MKDKKLNDIEYFKTNEDGESVAQSIPGTWDVAEQMLKAQMNDMHNDSLSLADIMNMIEDAADNGNYILALSMCDAVEEAVEALSGDYNFHFMKGTIAHEASGAFDDSDDLDFDETLFFLDIAIESYEQALAIGGDDDETLREFIENARETKRFVSNMIQNEDAHDSYSMLLHAVFPVGKEFKAVVRYPKGVRFSPKELVSAFERDWEDELTYTKDGNTCCFLLSGKHPVFITQERKKESAGWDEGLFHRDNEPELTAPSSMRLTISSMPDGQPSDGRAFLFFSLLGYLLENNAISYVFNGILHSPGFLLNGKDYAFNEAEVIATSSVCGVFYMTQDRKRRFFRTTGFEAFGFPEIEIDITEKKNEELADKILIGVIRYTLYAGQGALPSGIYEFKGEPVFRIRARKGKSSVCPDSDVIAIDVLSSEKREKR